MNGQTTTVVGTAVGVAIVVAVAAHMATGAPTAHGQPRAHASTHGAGLSRISMPAQRRSHDQGRTAVEALQVRAHVHVHAPRHRSPRAVQLPRTPTGLLQAVVQGTAMRAVASGSWIDSGHVHLSVHLARPLTPRRAQVQVEIHPLAVPFNGRADHSGPAFSYHGTSASVAAVDVAGLPDGAYHWRARIPDPGGPRSH